MSEGASVSSCGRFRPSVGRAKWKNPQQDPRFLTSSLRQKFWDLSSSEKPPLVRIHSECLPGDAFASLKCDCGPQLEASLKRIQEEGNGALVYMRQEGRGIGLYSKIQAYALQDQGHDTLDANLLLGLPADGREYDIAAEMLKNLGLTEIRLMTNNPLKIKGLQDNGITVKQRLQHQSGVGPRNVDYLSTKRRRMGHLLNVE